MSLLQKALGIKILEHDSEHLLVRLPFWLNGSRRVRMIDHIAADYKVKHGEDLKGVVGHRLVRFEGKMKP